MEYIVVPFAVAALIVAALVFPAVRLLAGLILLVGGLVVTMTGMIFGLPFIALGGVVILIEAYSRRTRRTTTPTAPQ